METEISNTTYHIDIERIFTSLSRANINSADSSGNTFLHLAILTQNERIVKFLINSGIDVNSRNFFNETPLNLAINYRPRSYKTNIIIKLLIDAGADVNTVGEDGRTALHEAAAIGDSDLVRLLISRGADVNAEDQEERLTPLHCAAAYVTSDDPAVFEALLTANSDVNVRNLDNETPLHVLSKSVPNVPCSLVNVVKVFLKFGADFYATDRNRQKPMDVAISCSNTEAVKAFVLVGGVDVNSKFTPDYSSGPIGETILHQACWSSNLATVKFLLKNGANVDALDDYNTSPLLDIIDIIINRQDKNEDLEEEMKLLKYLLKWNPDVNTTTTSGYNILHSWSRLRDLPDCLWKTILEHLAKLRAMDSPIHPSLLKIISRKPNYRCYFARCNRELENAKKSKLHDNSWVTVFNFLADDKRKLVQYSGNVDLIEECVKNYFVKNFPIYGETLKMRFFKAGKIRRIREEAAVVLSDLLPVDTDPTHFIIQNILRFLNKKDMQILCQ